MKIAERSRFDAAHELGHLILHRHTGSAHPRAESEADAFASACRPAWALQAAKAVSGA